MRVGRVIALVGPTLLACLAPLLAPLPSFGAGPTVTGSRPAPDSAQTGIVVVRGSGPPTVLTAGELAQLPTGQVTVSFGTDHGTRNAVFEGPLLWTVLDHAGAIDPGKPRDQVHQAVLITGRDGYTAVLALGEIAPAFEGKQVILAERMDGQPLDPEHLRIVVPGDRRGGRSVRDVARITVAAAPEPAPG